MSNEYKDWIADATMEDIVQAFDNAMEDGYFCYAQMLQDEIAKRGNNGKGDK